MSFRSFPPLSPHSADPSPAHFRQRYDRQMATLTERLKIPPASEIYAPNEARLAVRPRLHFGEITVADLRKRAADPRFAQIVSAIHAFAARAVALTPPETVVMDAHDPNRIFGDSLAWMATSLLIDHEKTRRAETLAGILKWCKALQNWGPFETNLSLAQSTIGLSIVYDWLHDELPEKERAAIRRQIIAQARFSLDESRGGLTMWRGQRFAANHNWAHHSARAYAALALWGDDDGPLAPGELKFWLDDALVDFWIVKHTHSSDGAPMEGAGYQDYGLRFYLDFLDQVENLLVLRESFYEENIRHLSARIYTLLPGNLGSMVYADGFPTNWNVSSSFNFRRLAQKFQDGRFQLLANLLQQAPWNHTPYNWRDLFASDFDLPAASLEELPLVRDMTDFGLYLARSDWSAEASFLGLRCGPASAISVVETLGYDFGEAHIYPNQGDVIFYHGASPVLPGCDYAERKLTSNHNLVLFEGRDTQAGRQVGQLGEGGAWFNARATLDPDADYENRDRPARMLAFQHAADHHRYLCEIGGLYRLRDERVPGGVFFPEYLRSVIFLPDGALALVDKIGLPAPRDFSFRLLTVGDNLALGDGGFTFSVAGKMGAIEDFSPGPFERSVEAGSVATHQPQPRAIAILRAKEASEAVFAVILAVGAAVGKYRIAVDALGYTLSGGGGVVVARIDWPKN